MRILTLYLIVLSIITSGILACSDNEVSSAGFFSVTLIELNGITLQTGQETQVFMEDQNFNSSSFNISFSRDVSLADFKSAITLRSEGNEISLFADLDADKENFIINTEIEWVANIPYELIISENLKSVDGASFRQTSYEFIIIADPLQLTAIFSGSNNVVDEETVLEVSRDLSFDLIFSQSIDASQVESNSMLTGNIELEAIQIDSNIVHLKSKELLEGYTRFIFSISDKLTGQFGQCFAGYSISFYTTYDSTFDFPEIPDEDLLTKVQEQTFKYFWDFAHPVSGLIRERNTSGDLVTIGGSGFGVMAILVGIERGFITRQEGIDRLETIVDFLGTADRFHGAWPHWMNGITGKTIPFSANDDGADLVETAFMIQGLLTARQYLNDAMAKELAIKNKITALWEAVEWDWFTQGGQDVLYWHWSPNFGWEKNLKISGWNESLIIYVLAAASPTHPIDASVYHNGWARSGAMANDKEFSGITLPLGPDQGGPLFFSHYSFLGLDPRNLQDQYANYLTQNTHHTLINRAYCISNPLNNVGYSATCWGLTASDGNEGYSAHSPNNDRGVITPTAAISSMPYTPEESMEAIRHFYYLLGDKLWGEYGFYDAFNLTAGWTANSYLAIDQGPIIIMIENHRTALLWELFMKDSEVTTGLEKLGFISW